MPRFASFYCTSICKYFQLWVYLAHWLAELLPNAHSCRTTTTIHKYSHTFSNFSRLDKSKNVPNSETQSIEVLTIPFTPIRDKHAVEMSSTEFRRELGVLGNAYVLTIKIYIYGGKLLIESRLIGVTCASNVLRKKTTELKYGIYINKYPESVQICNLF